MRIQPRKQILDVWRALLGQCHQDGVWAWGGRDERNSISDAEQLLCLLHPSIQIETFALHDPDAIKDDVRFALRPLGPPVRIPRAIVEIASEYFDRYTGDDGEPRFNAGSYLRPMSPESPPPTDEQRDGIDVVDSYSMSVTLCLTVLAFVRFRMPLERQAEHIRKLGVLQKHASDRLTAAMTGLLRSFVVNSVSPESAEGQAILSMLRQGGASDNVLQRRLRERFSRLREQLHQDVRLGVPEAAKPEQDELFECGWTWGIAEGAHEIDFVPMKIAHVEGVAASRPYLYFTVQALDGIVDLQSQRTRSLNLLDDGQLRLAEALKLRWDLTQRYWSTVARFDNENWPLQDIPWRTSDNEESDYYTLLVVSVVVQDLINRTATEADLVKGVGILEDLARRGRITARMASEDPAIRLHAPGVCTALLGGQHKDLGLAWHAYDYAPLLIKRSMQAAQLTADVEARERLMAVAEAAMDHLQSRRLVSGRTFVDLWDDVSRLPGSTGSPSAAGLSWYLTERVVEALVTTATAYADPPLPSSRMREHLLSRLNEADHLYNQELLEAEVDDRSALRDGLEQIGVLIGRARELQNRRTNTAIALAEEALRLLDRLATARDDAERTR